MFLKNTAAALAVLAALTLNCAQAANDSFQVNGENVSKAEQETLIRQYVEQGAQRTPHMEAQVRALLIRDKVLLQQARKQKLADRDDVRKLIDNATKNILMSSVINVWLQEHPVKEEDVRALFDAEKKRWGDTEVSVRHILVKDEKTAKDLLARVRKGENFAKLAKANSIDTERNRAEGGLIEWTSPVMFDKDFAEGFKNLKPGQTARKPVKSHLGWHVIKFEGRRAAKRFSNYEAEAPALRQILTQQHVQAYVNGLIKEAKITDAAGKNLK